MDPETPLACSLRGRDMADRRRWLDDLGRRALAVARSADGVSLKFPNDAELEAELRELARAESECCEFLTLEVRRLGDWVELAVTGPAAARPIIDEMLPTDRRGAP